MKQTVRVIRTYEVQVDAEYGDTQEDLEERGRKAVTSKTKFTETAVVLPREDD